MVGNGKKFEMQIAKLAKHSESVFCVAKVMAKLTRDVRCFALRIISQVAMKDGSQGLFGAFPTEMLFAMFCESVEMRITLQAISEIRNA